MFDQLSELVKQFGGEAVVNNPAVPNEQNDAVMQEAGDRSSGFLHNGIILFIWNCWIVYDSFATKLFY